MVTRRAGQMLLAVAVVLVTVGNFSVHSYAADKDKTSGLSGALGQATLFAGLTDGEKAALTSVATLMHAEEGERIIRQGKTTDRMYILLQGEAEVKVNGKVVATLPPQSLIGEIEFLDALPASADVIVLKKSLLIELNNAALTRLMKSHPRLGYALMSKIAKIEARRLRAMNMK